MMAENEFLDEGEESECGTITEIRNVAKSMEKTKKWSESFKAIIFIFLV